MNDLIGAISAYVPCFNNSTTVRHAVESVLSQSRRPAEILVIDDGSEDGTLDALTGLPLRVVRHDRNLGRGAARDTAMRQARFALVACCDATNAFEPDFLEKAALHFKNDQVAAVFGSFAQAGSNTVTLRWRARHLYRMSEDYTLQHQATLSTHGAMVRKSLVAQVGGYDPSLRYSEDGELGRRLLAAGFDVVFDPSLVVKSLTDNTPLQLLERYWRWNAGIDERASWNAYRRLLVYSIKVMAWQDLRDGDPIAALISLLCPHYQFWKSRMKPRR